MIWIFVTWRLAPNQFSMLPPRIAQKAKEAAKKQEENERRIKVHIFIF